MVNFRLEDGVAAREGGASRPLTINASAADVCRNPRRVKVVMVDLPEISASPAACLVTVVGEDRLVEVWAKGNYPADWYSG